MLWTQCTGVDPTANLVMRYDGNKLQNAMQCALQLHFDKVSAQFIYGLLMDIPPDASTCFIHVHCEGCDEFVIKLQKETTSVAVPQIPTRRTKDDRRPSGISFA